MRKTVTIKFSVVCVLADSWVGIEEMRDGSDVLAVVANYLQTWARHTSAKCQEYVYMVHLFPSLLPFLFLFQPVLMDYTPFTLYLST